MVKKSVTKNNLKFHEHVSRFFSDPNDFFEKTKEENFLISAKYFGLFLLLNLAFIFLSLYRSNTGVSLDLVFYLGFFGVLLFIYFVVPLFLFLATKILRLKTKLSKIYSLSLYVMSYLVLVNLLLSLLLGLVVRFIPESLFSFILFNFISVLILTLLSVSTIYYMLKGLTVYFDLEGKYSFWSMLIFLILTFLVLGLILGTLGGVLGLGTSPLLG